MIIIFLLQLLIGTMITIAIYGHLMNAGQRVIKIKNFTTILIITTILTIFFYGMIAYYFSVSIDIYVNKHNGKIFITIISFLLLTFMLNGSAKYADTVEEQIQILIAGTIGSLFFILIRFSPYIGEAIYGWLPVFIWV